MGVFARDDDVSITAGNEREGLSGWFGGWLAAAQEDSPAVSNVGTDVEGDAYLEQLERERGTYGETERDRLDRETREYWEADQEDADSPGVVEQAETEADGVRPEPVVESHGNFGNAAESFQLTYGGIDPFAAVSQDADEFGDEDDWDHNPTYHSAANDEDIHTA